MEKNESVHEKENRFCLNCSIFAVWNTEQFFFLSYIYQHKFLNVKRKPTLLNNICGRYHLTFLKKNIRSKLSTI